MICGIDVGSTTCKYVLASDEGDVRHRAYQRHGTRQAEMVLEFLSSLEEEHDLTPGRDRILLTGSGAGLIAPHIGGRLVQEVVALGAAVEALHPRVRFVSEIGGEDMKTIFWTGGDGSRSKQVLMQSACSGGTGTFIEKTARKLGITPERLGRMGYQGYALHKISSKCGIFAEADANTLLKAGVPTEEIVASLFEAVVFQNLASMTRGNTPAPEVLLLGGPNRFFAGLREAWCRHLTGIWKERGTPLPGGHEAEAVIHVPEDALFYAALGLIEIARTESSDCGLYRGAADLRWWVDEGQAEEKKETGRTAPWGTREEIEAFLSRYDGPASDRRDQAVHPQSDVVVGCDFGSTSAKAVCLTADGEIAFSCYSASKGNPIEDAKDLFRRVRQGIGTASILGVAVTGYGKNLIADVIGADCAVVETVAHATAGQHFFPDADCICDVGGVDVKIMLLRNGTVSDFRLNSQCSSGNGAFLEGVASRFDIPLGEAATSAFLAEAVPEFTMGCGVFLQSDIVNQQRKGWNGNEILAGLARILPLNVWLYAGGLNNIARIGRKFILQGGTHKNLAVVKAQVDFLRSRVPDAEIVVHPWSAEAGALGAALVGLDWSRAGGRTRFRGFQTMETLSYQTTTSRDTICTWCPVNCQRTFIDVAVSGAEGRPWSRIPTGDGWQRVIVNNSCAKGLVEDASELRTVQARMEQNRRAFPNLADPVRREAFRGH